MHFLFASDADAQVRRLTDSRFGVECDAAGVYLVDLKSGRKAGIVQPVPAEFDVAKVESLSQREGELFESLGDGRPMKQIAKQMMLSVKTVETYHALLKQKLEVGDGASVVRMAKVWKSLERTDDGA